MTRKKFFTVLAFFALGLLYPAHLYAAECTIDSSTMDRGEKRVFILGGEDIPPNYTLEGLSEANIAINCEQWLDWYGWTEEQQIPGLYLILRAEDDATTASMSILDGDTGDPVCEPLTISVPDRTRVAEASLTELKYVNAPFLILEIKGDESQDLSQACGEGLSFPESRWWPSLSLLSQEEMDEIPLVQRLLLRLQLLSLMEVDQPVICTESSIVALVKVVGQQRYPAKIVISKVRLGGGEEKEGVTYVTLPPPYWLDAMPDEDAKYVDVPVSGNTIHTRYFDKGRGDALLYVHGGQAGSGSSAQGFKTNYDYLSKYFHVYAVDKLGMGYTDNPKTDEDYEEYYPQTVEHVYEFMKAVGIGKVHLLGHSQGGYPVTRIALDHPEMVKSLVIVDSGTTAPSDPLGRTTPFMTYNSLHMCPGEGECCQSGSDMPRSVWSYSLNNIILDGIERPDWVLDKLAEASRKMRAHGMNPGSPVFREMKERALEEMKEGKMKVPTLVIWGYSDPSSWYDRGVELFTYLAGVPGSGLRLFDECGHSPYGEYPELFNGVIKSFCGPPSSPPIKESRRIGERVNE